MRNILTLGAVAALCGTTALAGGLDRSGQSVASIFDAPGSSKVSFGYVNPTVSGTDVDGNDFEAGQSYTQLGASHNMSLGNATTLSVSFDQPFGAKILYSGDATTDRLAGTGADLTSKSLNAYVKHNLNTNLSVFGGIRLQTIDGTVTLNGTANATALAVGGVAKAAGIADASVLATALAQVNAGQTTSTEITALGGLATVGALAAQVGTTSATFLATDGYKAEFDGDTAVGYTLGVAYEITDIALRVSAAYHSAIEHDVATTESFALNPAITNPSSTTIETPRSFNLDFQSGVAKDTLVMASFRWAEWGDFNVSPEGFGRNLADLGDSKRYTLGVGRRFSEAFSGSATLSYEAKGDGEYSSALSPTNGQMGLTLAGQYKTDGMTISGGINYTKLGDADIGVGGALAGSVKDSSVLGLGLQAKFEF